MNICLSDKLEPVVEALETPGTKEPFGNLRDHLRADNNV
jgi:hypothetical protein